MRQPKAFLAGAFLGILAVTAISCSQFGIVPTGEGPQPGQEPAVPVRKATEYLLFESSHPISLHWYASPDLKRVAYVATSDDAQFVVVDGKEDEHYDEVKLTRSCFSPDSQHIKYSAKSDGLWFGIVDEEKGMAGIFSPDSGRIVGITSVGDKKHIVVDGVMGRAYDAIWYPVFSPDSQRLAFVAITGDKDNRKLSAVVDRIRGKTYDDIWEIVFSPDSRHMAYIATWQGKRFVVLDGTEGKKYDHIYRLNIVFSPDSQHMAYIAQSGEKSFAVIDGVESKWYDGARDIIFSPDSQRVAYHADGYLVVDEIEEKVSSGGWISDIYFSPDSRRVAYKACKGGFWGNITGCFMVVDSRKDKTYNSVRDFVFSPDSRQGAYVASSDKKYFVVVNGTEGKHYDYIEVPAFSSDSKWLAYAAKVGEKAVVVMNGVEGQQYDEILFPEGGVIHGSKSYGAYQGGKIIFDSPDSLHYLAVRDNSIYLVEESIEQKAEK